MATGISTSVLNMETRAERLKKLIEELMQPRQSKRNFADSVGVTHTTINKWTKGLAYPETDSLQKLADLRGCSLNELRNYLEGRAESNEDICGFLDEVSFSRLLMQARRLPEPQKIQLAQVALAGVGQPINTFNKNNILLLGRNGNVRSFLKGDNMTIAQLLRRFIASTPALQLDQLLQELGYSREWLDALAAGTQPSDNDLDQIGLLLDSAEFTDDEGNAYFIERLEMMRGAPSDCRHHHAPNETVS